MGVVALRSGNVRTMGNGLASQKADAGVVPALGKVVACFKLVLPAAEFAGCLGGEVVRERQEDLRTKGLKQGPPSLPRKGRFQRTDALRGDNRDAFGLPGEAE